MNTTIHLLDEYRKALKLPSDSHAARKLGVAPSTISNYRQGVRQAEPRIVQEMARAIGMDEDVAMLRVHIEQEYEARNRSAWRKLLHRITAAAIIATFGITAGRIAAPKSGLHEVWIPGSPNDPVSWIETTPDVLAEIKGATVGDPPLHPEDYDFGDPFGEDSLSDFPDA